MLALDLTKFVDATDIDNLLNRLSELERVHLAQKILGDLPVEKRVFLLEKELSDSGLVIVMAGSNLYSQIQNVSKTNLADVIEAVVVARRQR